MKMIGQLIESKVALLDAVSSITIHFYTNQWVELDWNVDPAFDTRQYYVSRKYPSRIYLKNSGIFDYSYAINSFVAASSKKYGSIEVSLFLNGVRQGKTASYSTIKHRDVGSVSNIKSGRLKVESTNAFIEIKARRTSKYTGSVRLEADETEFNIKRERPL